MVSFSVSGSLVLASDMVRVLRCRLPIDHPTTIRVDGDSTNAKTRRAPGRPTLTGALKRGSHARGRAAGTLRRDWLRGGATRTRPVPAGRRCLPRTERGARACSARGASRDRHAGDPGEIAPGDGRLEPGRDEQAMHGFGLVVAVLDGEEPARRQPRRRARDDDAQRRGAVASRREGAREARSAGRPRRGAGRPPGCRAGCSRSRRRAPAAPPRTSRSAGTSRSRVPAAAALARAHASASREASVASTCACGRSPASARAMAPEPVPRSSTRSGRSGGNCSSTASTSVSVSGRGISTAGVTRRSSPQNSRRPVR